MQFISLKNIFDYCKLTSTNFNKENIELAKAALKDFPEHIIIDEKSHTKLELELFLGQMNEETIIFQNWIQNNRALLTLLETGNPSQVYLEDSKIKEHFLYLKYKRYLSPFLERIVKTNLKSNETNFNQLDFASSAINFTTGNTKTILDETLNQVLKSKLEIKNSQLNQASNVKEFNNSILFLTDKKLVVCINRLDKRFYSTVLEYVTFSTNLLQRKYLTPEMANQVFTNFQNLNLNPEHKDQITELRQGIRTGQIKSLKKNSKSSQKKSLIKSIKTNKAALILVCFVLVIVSTTLLFLNTSNTKSNLISSTNGFDSLSINEMEEIDSLLGFHSDTSILEEEIQSTLTVNSTPTFVLSVKSLEIENERIEKLHNDLITDYQLQEALYYQGYMLGNCDALPISEYSDFQMSNCEDFKENSGFNHTLTNKTGYDVYAVAFDNTKNGKSYGKLIPANSRVEIQLSKNQTLFFYTGNSMTKFSPARSDNNGYGTLKDAKKVSPDFKAHFCDQNEETYHFLNSIFVVSKEQSNSVTSITNTHGSISLISDIIEKAK